jgi:hypothetical protein
MPSTKRGPDRQVLTDDERQFINDWWCALTNKELAEIIGCKLTWLRTRLYEMGFKRMELEYWTKVQVNFLLRNYSRYGDMELAEIMQKKWPKQKGWTLKHIEKKRLYLKLKRTEKQLRAIKDRAIKKGVYLEGLKRTWAARGMMAEGSIVFWRTGFGKSLVPYIKVNGKWIHWNRHVWRKAGHRIRKGTNIVFKPDTYKPGDFSCLKLENLEVITDKALARRTGEYTVKALSLNYVAGLMTHGDRQTRELLKTEFPGLIELKRKQLLLQREITSKTESSWINLANKQERASRKWKDKSSSMAAITTM